MKEKDNTLTQVAYDEICERIVSFSYLPGTVISDHVIANELKMSRAPVREAILHLIEAGLVEKNEDGKNVITNITMNDISDIMHVRCALESEAVRLIAEKGWLGRSQIEELCVILDKMDEIGRSGAEQLKEHYSYDDEFHMKLASYSESKRIVEILGKLRLQMQRVRWLNVGVPERQTAAQTEHRKIIDSIIKQSLQETVENIEVHLENSVKALEFVTDNRHVKIFAKMVSALSPE